MSTRGEQVTLPFIVITNTRKADSKTRKLIRSHVMLGKNRKPTRESKNPNPAAVPQTNTPVTKLSPFRFEIPKTLCSKFSGIKFAADVEPSLVEDVMVFTSMLFEAMFLINKCIEPTESDIAPMWFVPMLADPAYLYASCFTTQAVFDDMLGRTRSAEATRRDDIYYAKTVRTLRERLATGDDSIRLSDSTIMTVLLLSGHAFLLGDSETEERHLEGMLKMVSIRGADTFIHNTRLMVEIARSDLALAIDKGDKPVLFDSDNIPWALKPIETECCDPTQPMQLQFTGDHVVNSLSSRLAEIWSATLNFCTTINAAAMNQTSLMPEETFLHHMGSIMYRLLQHRFNTGSLDEAFRLGLVAFLYPLFLNWNRDQKVDRRFHSNYRVALAAITSSDMGVDPHMRLWLFMIGALIMSNEAESLIWLKMHICNDIALCGISSWNEVKDTLESFVWTAMVYDRPVLGILEV